MEALSSQNEALESGSFETEIVPCNLPKSGLRVIGPEKPRDYLPELIESGFLSKPLMDEHSFVVLENCRGVPCRLVLPHSMNDQLLHRDEIWNVFESPRPRNGYEGILVFRSTGLRRDLRNGTDTVIADPEQIFYKVLEMICFRGVDGPSEFGLTIRGLYAQIVERALKDVDASILREISSRDEFFEKVMLSAIRKIDPNTFFSNDPAHEGVSWSSLLFDDSIWNRMRFNISMVAPPLYPQDPGPTEAIKLRFSKMFREEDYRMVVEPLVYRHEWGLNQALVIDNERVFHGASRSDICFEQDKVVNSDGKIYVDRYYFKDGRLVRGG